MEVSGLFTNTSYLTSLSSAIDFTHQAILSATQALSANRDDTPYDAIKYSFFDRDYKFPTIDEIEIPATVTSDTIQKGLLQKVEAHQDRVLDEVVNNEADLNDVNRFSMLSELSGETTWVITPDKNRKYIEFFEVLRSIDMTSLTSQEICQEYINRLGYCMLQVLTQKTVKDITV
jgi:hypothetical protein